MKARFFPQLHATAYDVLRAVLGTHELLLIVVIPVLLVSLGWTGDFIYEQVGGQWLWWVFPVAVLVLALAARRYRQRLVPRVCEDEAPAPARGLVMFLSVLRPDLEKKLDARLAADRPRMLLEHLRDQSEWASLPWRMNVEAIQYHLSRLQWVVVIPSPQSAAQLPLFDRLLRNLWPEASFQRLDLGRAVEYRRGLSDLAEATEAAFEVLTADKGLAVGDVFIDITSGTAVSTTAGVMVALGEGRRIQYVEGEPGRRTYRVLQVDIRFEK